MASGVKVAEETIEAYNAIKLRKKDYRCIFMGILNGEVKVVGTMMKDSSKSQEEEFNAFLDELPNDVGRYIIIDLLIPQKNGAKKDILFLVTWCPNGAPTRSHIEITTSKKALMDKIREGLTEIQANDLSDLVYSEFLERGCK